MKKAAAFLALLLGPPLLLFLYLLPEFLRPLPDLSILRSDEKLVARFGLQDWVPLGRISRPAVKAVLLCEDDTFYRHKGIAPFLVRRAFLEDLASFRFKRGASTITQQVARNVFLTRERSLQRKAREWALAKGMERTLTKDRILEVYLNVAEFGKDLRGISSASHYYLKKDPAALTPKEGAFLAMLLPSPRRYASSFEKGKLTPYAAGTLRRTLGRFVRDGDLTLEECEAEMARPLVFEADPAFVPDPPAREVFPP